MILLHGFAHVDILFAGAIVYILWHKQTDGTGQKQTDGTMRAWRILMLGLLADGIGRLWIKMAAYEWTEWVYIEPFAWPYWVCILAKNASLCYFVLYILGYKRRQP